MTSEQLEASRAERMRLDGRGALTLEDARTWIEETGLCLFLPKRQFSSAVAPSFVEAVAGGREITAKHSALAEELLVRLEADGVAVRLNLLGLPGEAPDFVVASWVLPYVYALRGDRDWRRTPQLTGSRQVSQLAVETYKLLEMGDTTLAKLTHALGREVTEGAVLRAITELWQQLRIIPVVSAPGATVQWQLLRTRYQKAIAEGASTSQVTAISVLASIYLQAVIAAGMEEVELYLAPLTARSKVREVLRGLVATRQVHTVSLGHAPLFYVAGTLPEYAIAPTIFASSSIPASSYYLHSLDPEEELPEPVVEAKEKPAAAHKPRPAVVRKPAASAKTPAARPHFSRSASHSRDHKPAQASGSRPVRRAVADSRPSAARSANGARPASARLNSKTAATNSKRNGARPGIAPSNGNHGKSNHSNGNGSGRPVAKGNGRPAARPASGTRATSSSSWSPRKVVKGRATSAKPVAGRSTSSRKPALTAGAKAGNSKRYGITARPQAKSKKRG